MSDQTFQVVMMLMSGLGAVAMLAVAMYLKSLKSSIDVCIADTKDCNMSIATLAKNSAVTDGKVDQVIVRIDSHHRQIFDIVQRISKLEAHREVE